MCNFFLHFIFFTRYLFIDQWFLHRKLQSSWILMDCHRGFWAEGRWRWPIVRYRTRKPLWTPRQLEGFGPLRWAHWSPGQNCKSTHLRWDSSNPIYTVPRDMHRWLRIQSKAMREIPTAPWRSSSALWSNRKKTPTEEKEIRQHLMYIGVSWSLFVIRMKNEKTK